MPDMNNIMSDDELCAIVYEADGKGGVQAIYVACGFSAITASWPKTYKHDNGQILFFDGQEPMNEYLVGRYAGYAKYVTP